MAGVLPVIHLEPPLLSLEDKMLFLHSLVRTLEFEDATLMGPTTTIIGDIVGLILDKSNCCTSSKGPVLLKEVK
jgi:hypothetical protein